MASENKHDKTNLASPTFWPGTKDSQEIGPTGDGTPHARMEYFWERMKIHQDLIAELTGWSPFYSELTRETSYR
jgi:hypothetical protein